MLPMWARYLVMSAFAFGGAVSASNAAPWFFGWTAFLCGFVAGVWSCVVLSGHTRQLREVDRG